MRNTAETYGWVAIALHWIMALTIFGLFGLGLYMVELGYYDALYNRLPAIHKSIGILLAMLLLLRLFWRWTNPLPSPLAGNTGIENMLARLAHRTLYGLIAAVLFSGYLISTADGSPIDVFGLFHVPATITDIPAQEDNAGIVHLYLSYTLVALAVLHAATGLKHHFIDRDNTLRRILGLVKR